MARKRNKKQQQKQKQKQRKATISIFPSTPIQLIIPTIPTILATPVAPVTPVASVTLGPIKDYPSFATGLITAIDTGDLDGYLGIHLPQYPTMGAMVRKLIAENKTITDRNIAIGNFWNQSDEAWLPMLTYGCKAIYQQHLRSYKGTAVWWSYKIVNEYLDR